MIVHVQIPEMYSQKMPQDKLIVYYCFFTIIVKNGRGYRYFYQGLNLVRACTTNKYTVQSITD